MKSQIHVAVRRKHPRNVVRIKVTRTASRANFLNTNGKVVATVPFTWLVQSVPLRGGTSSSCERGKAICEYRQATELSLLFPRIAFILFLTISKRKKKTNSSECIKRSYTAWSHRSSNVGIMRNLQTFDKWNHSSVQLK